jgi:threonine dehydrogenase-like Zn-dependent dehydrogenase
VSKYASAMVLLKQSIPVHYYLEGRNGDFALQAPLVLGHEAAGVITAVGPGVKNLVPGQRVAIEAGIMCKECNYCQVGRYNLCKGMRFASSAKTFPHLDGTLQDRMNHPAHVIHPWVIDFTLAPLNSNSTSGSLIAAASNKPPWLSHCQF